VFEPCQRVIMVLRDNLPSDTRIQRRYSTQNEKRNAASVYSSTCLRARRARLARRCLNGMAHARGGRCGGCGRRERAKNGVSSLRAGGRQRGPAMREPLFARLRNMPNTMAVTDVEAGRRRWRIHNARYSTTGQAQTVTPTAAQEPSVPSCW